MTLPRLGAGVKGSASLLWDRREEAAGWGVVLVFLFINIMKKYNIRPNLTEPHPLIRVFMQQEIAPYGRIGRMAGIGDFFN